MTRVINHDDFINRLYEIINETEHLQAWAREKGYTFSEGNLVAAMAVLLNLRKEIQFENRR